jgi:hypothetical protein
MTGQARRRRRHLRVLGSRVRLLCMLLCTLCMHGHVFLPAWGTGDLRAPGGLAICLGATPPSSWLWVLWDWEWGDQALARRSPRFWWSGGGDGRSRGSERV